ncbi:MAG: hypothetical protein E5V74_12655 [Mesorhizobium sp.]|nr:MAG: hypothetical protein E5V74_12655 [Mesorhizobium sp.]
MAPASRPALFSPFTGRRCRQADEGRRRRPRLAIRPFISSARSVACRSQASNSGSAPPFRTKP